MDIVVTSGPILKHPTPAIEAGWLAPGAFASLVDFDSYWQGAALSERTVGINLGLALADMATAIRVYERAIASGIGRELPL